MTKRPMPSLQQRDILSDAVPSPDHRINYDEWRKASIAHAFAFAGYQAVIAGQADGNPIPQSVDVIPEHLTARWGEEHAAWLIDKGFRDERVMVMAAIGIDALIDNSGVKIG